MATSRFNKQLHEAWHRKFPSLKPEVVSRASGERLRRGLADKVIAAGPSASAKEILGRPWDDAVRAATLFAELAYKPYARRTRNPIKCDALQQIALEQIVRLYKENLLSGLDISLRRALAGVRVRALNTRRDDVRWARRHAAFLRGDRGRLPPSEGKREYYRAVLDEALNAAVADGALMQQDAVFVLNTLSHGEKTRASEESGKSVQAIEQRSKRLAKRLAPYIPKEEFPAVIDVLGYEYLDADSYKDEETHDEAPITVASRGGTRYYRDEFGTPLRACEDYSGVNDGFYLAKNARPSPEACVASWSLHLQKLYPLTIQEKLEAIKNPSGKGRLYQINF